MLPARLDDYRLRYGPDQPYQELRRRPGPAQIRPRDLGTQADRWRMILLDQLRTRGANFYGV